MPKSAELADLRDIHLPEAVSAWPPGPAYYALIALAIICLLLFVKYKQRQRYTAPKRQALLELEQIKCDYLESPHSQEAASKITTLLKRVALVYHPRVDVASLHGQDWLHFLEDTSQQIDFQAVQNSLIDTPFNPEATEDLTPLLSAASDWIKQRRKRCLN
ncbi:MAG: DUF4381 domain-containing protein [Legionellaceae bacterium]|nr:DUF4381 domain-containing protein [Legionellaceae bacterium]